jgi:amino acid permease
VRRDLAQSLGLSILSSVRCPKMSRSRNNNNNNNNNNNSDGSMAYEKVAVSNSLAPSLCTLDASGKVDALSVVAESAVIAIAPPPLSSSSSSSSPMGAFYMRAFSMEPAAQEGGGGGGEQGSHRRRRRRAGKGVGGASSISLQEVPSNDDEHDHGDASSDDGSSSSGRCDHEQMLEQEEFAAVDHHGSHHHHHTNNHQTSNNHNSSSTITIRQAFVHLLKGYVGPGCLSLPWAMSQLGSISVGVIMIFVVCLWSSYNCRVVLLLKRQRQLQQHQQQQQHQNDHSPSRRINNSRQHHQHQNNNNNNIITYPQLADWLYPGRGHLMRRLTTGCICIQQLAVCTVFLSFVGTNLQAVYLAVWDVHLSHQLVITLALPAVLALSCLPHLRALAPVTFLATLLLMLGFCLIAVVIAKVAWWNNDHQMNEHSQQQHFFDSDSATASTGSNYKNWPMAICAILYRYVQTHSLCNWRYAADNVVFRISGSRTVCQSFHLMLLAFSLLCVRTCCWRRSFEGICLVLPVEQAMTPRQAKRHFMPTFALAMLTSATIFATLSYFCVATFGPITNGSITAFLLQKYATNDATNDHDDLTHNGQRFLQDAQEQQQQQQQPYLMDWLLAANAVVSLSVLITYPLQIFPALELAEPILNPTKSTSTQLERDGLELIPQQDDDDNGDDNDKRHDDDDDNVTSHASPKQGTTLVDNNEHKEKKNRHWDDDDDDDRLPFRVVAHHQQPSSQRAARGKASSIQSVNGLAPANEQGHGSDTRISSTASMQISTATDERATVATSSHDNDEKERESSDINVASVKTRIILVLLTFVVAVAVPNVQVLISLAGALAGSTVALLIPPALEIAWLLKCQESTTTMTTPPSKFTRDLIRCYLLFALGFLFLCIGTGASLLDIFETNHGQGSSSATTGP